MAQSFYDQIKPMKQACRLVEVFNAADSSKNGSITVRELEKIKRRLPSNKLETVKAKMHENHGQLTMSNFLDLTVDKPRSGNELANALKSGLKRMNSDKNALFRGEEVCDIIRSEGIHLSYEDSEYIEAAIDNYGFGAKSFQDLEIVADALAS